MSKLCVSTNRSICYITMSDNAILPFKEDMLGTRAPQ